MNGALFFACLLIVVLLGALWNARRTRERALGDLEDGHLEADEYWRTHREEEA